MAQAYSKLQTELWFLLMETLTFFPIPLSFFITMPTKVSLPTLSRSAHTMVHVKPEWSQEQITVICTFFFHLYLKFNIKGDDRRKKESSVQEVCVSRKD